MPLRRLRDTRKGAGMNAFALRFAFRELQGGLAGFRVFLLCLVLGVGGIAAVGSLGKAITEGLTNEGREILGGDVAISLTWRMATAPERAWMEAQGAVSEIAQLRSMLSHGDQFALTEAKGVDTSYPLYGEARLADGGDLQMALAVREGVPGLLTDQALAERLGLAQGDEVHLGAGRFEFRGVLAAEPDLGSSGLVLAPRSMTSLEGLRAAGLISPGVAYDMQYRLRLAEDVDLATARAEFERRFADSGARWRDHRDAAPGTRRFVERLTAFLTIVGLASLAIGGVGIGTGVRDYLARRTATIAALRTLGATGQTVLMAYAIQIGTIAAFGIALALLLGGGIISWGGPLLARGLPVPAEFGFHAAPLLRAALFGALIVALFTALPLARLRQLRPAELFRDQAAPRHAWPGRKMAATIAALALASGAAVIGLSEAPKLAAWCMAGLVTAFALLWVLGRAGAGLARRISHTPLARHRPGLRLALGSIGAPGAGAAETVLALGLGLAVLSTIGQIDANMQRLITRELPVDSPAFFLLDVQPAQLSQLEEIIASTNGVDRLATAPMLRGTITHLDGVPASEAKIDDDAKWILQGDRGVSLAATPPAGTELTEGSWWAADYSGPPLVSFSAKEAEALGLKVGSTLTVNILGRPVTAKIASLRHVEWQGLGINFMMIMDPAALEGAPHTLLATLHARPEAEGALMRALADAMPNVTPILVRTQIERVADAMTEIATGTRWAALAVLLSGLAVLIGTSASGEDRRNREAAILKVLGASRMAILGSFALRSALLGLFAASIALVLGTVSAWAVQHFVLDADYVLPLRQTIAILASGVGLGLAAGLGFAIAPLRRRPAAILRTRA